MFQITEDDIKSGFLNVVQNTGLQGRWQKLQENPIVICDTAHNLDGLKIVIPQIINQEFNQLHIVLGLVNDKKLEEILPLFPKNAIYYFCTPNIPRGLSVALLHEKARTFNLNGKVYTSVSAAYEAAKKGALRDDFIFVGGSTFVVAEIL